MANGTRYPATAYDREPGGWEVTSRDISQIKVAQELAASLAHGSPLRGGPLRKQLPDGSMGAEDGSALSIVWGMAEQEDGSRSVLGWYESSR